MPKQIKCRNCGKLVNSKRQRCQFCGTMLRFSVSSLIIIIAIVLAVSAFIIIGVMQSG